MFSHISQNWRGRPLISHEVIINLIGSTTTKKGLKIECELDENKYEAGIKITDEQMDSINIVRDEKLGNWNYTIKPSMQI
jgi:flagellar hook assembly protein FlgD